MGQIIPSDQKNRQQSIEEQLGGAIKPSNLGTFTIPEVKTKTNYGGWVINPSLEDKRVGAGDIKPMESTSPELDAFGVDNIRKLRQMGFTPDNILNFLELQKKQSLGITPKSEKNTPEVSGEAIIDQQNTDVEPGTETSPLSSEKESYRKFRKLYKKIPVAIITRTPRNETTPEQKTVTIEETAQIKKEKVTKVLRTFLPKSRFTITPPDTSKEDTPLQTSVDAIPETISFIEEIKPQEITPVESMPTEEQEITSTAENHVASTSTTEEISPVVEESIGSEEKITPVPLGEIANITRASSAPENPFLRRMNSDLAGGDKATSEITPAQEVIMEHVDDIQETAVEESFNEATPSEEIGEPSPLTTLSEQAPQAHEYLQRKNSAVAKLFEMRLARLDNTDGAWKYFATPVPLQDTTKQVEHMPENLHVEHLLSWRDTPKIQEMSEFLNDLTGNLGEQALITKYIPTYVNPNNPSSWASVSSFSANEIINGGEDVYGLMHDARFEISTLLNHLGNIDEELDGALPSKKYNNAMTTYQDYFTDNPKLTIHDYYEEVRRRIAEADKNEKK